MAEGAIPAPGAPAVMHGGGHTTEGAGAGTHPGAPAGAQGAPAIDLANPAVQAEIQRQVDASVAVYNSAKTEYETAAKQMQPYTKLINDPAFQEYSRMYDAGITPVVTDPNGAPQAGAPRGDANQAVQALNRELVNKHGYDEPQAEGLTRAIMLGNKQMADAMLGELDARFGKLGKENDKRQADFNAYKERRLIQDLEYENPVVAQKGEEIVRVMDLREHRPQVEEIMKKYPGLPAIEAYKLSASPELIVSSVSAKREEAQRAERSVGLGGRTRVRAADVAWPELDERGTHGLTLSSFRDSFRTGVGLDPEG